MLLVCRDKNDKLHRKTFVITLSSQMKILGILICHRLNWFDSSMAGEHPLRFARTSLGGILSKALFARVQRSGFD